MAVTICLVLLLILNLISILASRNTLLVGTIGLFLTVTTIIIDGNEPKAMDVYQGKTELKKTYINNVCVDSCVIFKDID